MILVINKLELSVYRSCRTNLKTLLRIVIEVPTMIVIVIKDLSLLLSVREPTASSPAENRVNALSRQPRELSAGCGRGDRLLTSRRRTEENGGKWVALPAWDKAWRHLGDSWRAGFSFVQYLPLPFMNLVCQSNHCCRTIVEGGGK